MAQDDIQLLEHYRQRQLELRKRLKPPLLAYIVLFPVVYVTQLDTLPRELLQAGLLLSMFAILALAFNTRLALMLVRFQVRNDNRARKLLEFAEPDDLELSPQQALEEMEKRRQQSLLR